MSPKAIEPHTERQSSPFEGTLHTHPAFGLLKVNRVSGESGALFGSDFHHQNFIRLTLTRARLSRSLSKDWVYSVGLPLAEVDMSQTQWARLVSSLNFGEGTPVTIRHTEVDGPVPYITPRAEIGLYEDEGNDAIRAVVDRIDRTIERVESELSTLSNKRRVAVLEELHRARREVTEHLPFVKESFARTLEKNVEMAKIEIAAYAETMRVIDRPDHAKRLTDG